MKILGIDFGGKKKQQPIKKKRQSTPQPLAPKSGAKVVPPGRVSKPSVTRVFDLDTLKSKTEIVKPSFITEVIPLIRKLYKINEDLGSVLYDAVQLTNTGHKIKFDKSVKPDLQSKMRKHLADKAKNWMTGTANIDGMVNKWVAQIYVSGALSIETVPDRQLLGVEYVAMVNPETIVYRMDKKGRYTPLQKINHLYGRKKQYIKLNTNTYKYYGILSDEDTPYGVPPFMTALSAISTQGNMKDNIDHILTQLGLLGYLEVKMEKPDQLPNESEDSYKARLSNFLLEAKQNTLSGFKDGVVVGYVDDHDFDFHSTTKNLTGVSDLYNMNEIQIANGLKTTGSFIGVKTGNSESSLSIVFTKMLSQLKNVQQIMAAALQHTYELELRLAGFDFKGLEVEFKPSTITDDLKLWQSKEIKQRVLRNLWIDRIISAAEYADSMGYDKPHKKIEPPQPGATNAPDAQKKKEDREKDKDKSDRKGREKEKPQPKRKDADTKTK